MVVWVLLIFAWAANFVIRIGFSALLPSFMLATWAPLFFAEVGVSDPGRAGSYTALQGLPTAASLLRLRSFSGCVS